MEAHVGRRWQQVASLKIALGQRPFDANGLLPDARDIGAALRSILFRYCIMLAGSNPTQFPQNIIACATREARHQNAAVTLADRKTWIVVAMCRATGHSPVAGPGAAKSAYEVNKFLGRSFGREWHRTTSCSVATSPLPSFSAWRCDPDLSTMRVGALTLIASSGTTRARSQATNGSDIIGQSSGRFFRRSAYLITKASQSRIHSVSVRGLLISANPLRNALAISSTDQGWPLVRPTLRNACSRSP